MPLVEERMEEEKEEEEKGEEEEAAKATSHPMTRRAEQTMVRGRGEMKRRGTGKTKWERSWKKE